MYLGGDGDRGKQLEALGMLLTGYSLALRTHGVGQGDLAFLAKLEDFLRERTGARDGPWLDRLRETSTDDQAAWNRLWGLVSEFRERWKLLEDPTRTTDSF